MSIKPLIILPDPVLRQVSKPIERVDAPLRRLADDMLETMYDAPGIGLAAIQIGEPLRLLVIDLAKEGEEPAPHVFINPEILEKADARSVYEEGCLSIPDYYAEVERPATVRVRYLDRDGKVQSVTYRMPEKKKGKGADDDIGSVPKARPPVTNKGQDMIGDFRTDALHEALDRAPIEDDTLMALLVLAFAGQNVSVRTDGGQSLYGSSQLAKHAATLFDAAGQLQYTEETLRVAARLTLSEVLSCRRNASNSGIVARVAGDAIGANIFLPNMGTADFLSCLSRQALEASCTGTPVLPRARVKDTRAALVDHFKEERFVHASALFAPDETKLAAWLATNAPDPEEDEQPETADEAADASEDPVEAEGEFREAAE